MGQPNVKVVLDANLVAALLIPLPYSEQASHRLQLWKQRRAELHAPLLLEYEVISVLRKAVVLDWLTGDEADLALHQMQALNILNTPPSTELHQQALSWAEKLNHSKTYDAHYLALADYLHAEFWTADGRLANRAQQIGLNWVYHIEKSEPAL